MKFVMTADAEYGGQCEETKTEACNVQSCGPACPVSGNVMLGDKGEGCEDGDTGEPIDEACCHGDQEDKEPNYDCQGSWSDYSACSATCGEGQQARTYQVTTPKKGEGRECPAAHGETEKKTCNLQESCCPQKTFANPAGDCIDTSFDGWYKFNNKVPTECCKQGISLG